MLCYVMLCDGLDDGKTPNGSAMGPESAEPRATRVHDARAQAGSEAVTISRPVNAGSHSALADSGAAT